MATLQARIEDYTGALTSALQTTAVQFLEDGCVEVSKAAMLAAPTKVHRFTVETAKVNTTNWSIAESGEVIRATYQTSVGEYDAQEESASLSSQMKDSGSIYYATNTSPKYTFPGADTIQFYPTYGSTGIIIKVYQLPDQYASISVSHSAITNFPTDYLVLPVLYTAYKIFHKKLVDLGSSLPTDLEVDGVDGDATKVFDAITDLATLVDVDDTTFLDLTSFFTSLASLIDVEEDVELAQAKIGEITTKLTEVNQELQNKIAKIGVEEREFGQNLAKNLQAYTTLIQKLNTDYQWLASQYTNIKSEYNEKIATLLGIAPAKA